MTDAHPNKQIMTSYRRFTRHIINLAVAILEILDKVNKVHIHPNIVQISRFWLIIGFQSFVRFKVFLYVWDWPENKLVSPSNMAVHLGYCPTHDAGENPPLKFRFAYHKQCMSPLQSC